MVTELVYVRAVVHFDILIQFSKKGDEKEGGGVPVCANQNLHLSLQWDDIGFL